MCMSVHPPARPLWTCHVGCWGKSASYQQDQAVLKLGTALCDVGFMSYPRKGFDLLPAQWWAFPLGHLLDLRIHDGPDF